MYFILNPLCWPDFVRYLRRSEPSTPPTLMLAACGCIAFSQGIRLWLGPFSLCLLVAMASVMQLLATFVVLSLTCDCLKRLVRHRYMPCWRQRWWFELSRLALLIGMSASCAFMMLMILDLTFNVRLLSWANYLLQVAMLCGSVFFVTCTCGIALAKLSGRSRVGRAYRCIQFFYLGCIGCLIIFVVGVCGIHIRAPVAMLFCLAAGCLIWAVCLHLRNQSIAAHISH